MKALREIILHTEAKPVGDMERRQNQYQLNQNFKLLVDTITALEQRIEDLEARLEKEA